MNFDTYSFKEAVRNYMPYGEQWQNDESREAKLINAIGQAIASQLHCQDYSDQVEDFKRTASVAIEQVQNIYATVDFNKEHEMAKALADEKRSQLLQEFTNHVQSVEARLRQELENEQEAFKVRAKKYTNELKIAFMEELRAIK
jgi:hypothetical protein